MFNVKKQNIQVDELVFKQNFLKDKSFKLDPKLSRKVGKINENLYYTKLILELKNTKDKPFPADIKVAIKIVFDVEFDGENETELYDFLKLQAVHILYPYLRSTLSNLTTNAMLSPIILPIVNAMKLFENENNN